MNMIDAVGDQEQSYVSKFLKEITDIEDINQRFQLSIAERQNETTMKANPFKYPVDTSMIDVRFNGESARVDA